MWNGPRVMWWSGHVSQGWGQPMDTELEPAMGMAQRLSNPLWRDHFLHSDSKKMLTMVHP